MAFEILSKRHLMRLGGTLLLSGIVSLAMGQGGRDIRMHSVQHGIASFYSSDFDGQLTSAGDIFSNKGMTAASNTLPLGTIARVTNLRNHKWVLVRINDRMNKSNKRTIDLTKAAARELGMVRRGTVRVRVEAIPPAFYTFFHIKPDELMAAIEDDNVPKPETL